MSGSPSTRLLREARAALREALWHVRGARLGIQPKRYDPSQPRVPAGHPEGGRWAPGRGAPGGGRSRRDEAPRRRVAQVEMGRLAADFDTGLGRRCVYRLSFGLVAVPGPVHMGCPKESTPAATSHGTLLNDN